MHYVMHYVMHCVMHYVMHYVMQGICDELYPSWSMWEQFITDMQGRALQLDALRSSHPIQVPILLLTTYCPIGGHLTTH